MFENKVLQHYFKVQKKNYHKEKLPNSQHLSTKGKEPYSLAISTCNFLLINKREEKRERKKTLAYFFRRWLYNNLDSNPLILNLERHIKIVREILKSTDARIHTAN